MDCVNHPDRERAAFCQSCGRPVCGECVHAVGTSVFCEPCLAARVAGTAPPVGYGYGGGAGGYSSAGGYGGVAGYSPGSAGYPAGAPHHAGTGEPSPGLAALLGFIPGVGAMYNGQYAKGFVHLIVFAVLVSLADDVNDIFGLFLAGWICYMAIEAHHTARARRDGTPLPDPFGLNDLSERLGLGRAWPGGAPNTTPTQATQVPPSAGPAADVHPPVDGADTYFHQAADGPQTYSAPGAYFHQAADGSQTYAVPGAPPVPPMHFYRSANLPYSQSLPMGAVLLIVVGLYCMAGNSPFFHILHGRLPMPILAICAGVWIFVRKMTGSGQGNANGGTALGRWRLIGAMQSSVWIVLAGVVWLLDALGIVDWRHSWPLFLIVWGALLLFQRVVPGAVPGGCGSYPPAGWQASPGQPDSAPPGPPVDGTDPVAGAGTDSVAQDDVSRSEPGGNSGDTSGGGPGNNPHNNPRGDPRSDREGR